MSDILSSDECKTAYLHSLLREMQNAKSDVYVDVRDVCYTGKLTYFCDKFLVLQGKTRDSIIFFPHIEAIEGRRPEEQSK